MNYVIQNFNDLFILVVFTTVCTYTPCVWFVLEEKIVKTIALTAGMGVAEDKETDPTTATTPMSIITTQRVITMYAVLHKYCRTNNVFKKKKLTLLVPVCFFP